MRFWRANVRTRPGFWSECARLHHSAISESQHSIAVKDSKAEREGKRQKKKGSTVIYIQTVWTWEILVSQWTVEHSGSNLSSPTPAPTGDKMTQKLMALIMALTVCRAVKQEPTVDVPLWARHCRSQGSSNSYCFLVQSATQRSLANPCTLQCDIFCLFTHLPS